VIRTFDAAAKLIILTTYIGEEDVFRAMSAGAKGYLLKDEEPETLFGCIRKVAAGGKHISTQVAEKLSDRLPGEQLSDRETTILKQLAQGKSNNEIAQSVDITESTVKFHMNNILSKLHVSDRTQAVLVAIRKGLLRVT
jgi:two-component system NarL family response regulator